MVVIIERSDTIRHKDVKKQCSDCVTTQVGNPHCAQSTRVCRMELCFIPAPVPTANDNAKLEHLLIPQKVSGDV